MLYESIISVLAGPFVAQAKTLKKVEAIEADLKALHIALGDHKDAIKQMNATLRGTTSSVSFYDEPATWASFCGDRYVARNPTFALEVPWMKVAGGVGLWRLRADTERVKVWARRLSEDGPASVDIIFMVGPNTLHRGPAAGLSAYAIDNVIRFIFLMRAVRNCFPSSNFGKIKAYLVSAARSHQSVFVGQRKCASGFEDVAITYADARDPIPRDYAVHDPCPLIVTTDLQVIRNWAVQNEVLRGAAARQLTLDDLEKEFASIVPQDDSTIMSDADIRDWASSALTERPETRRDMRTEEDDGVVVIDTWDGHFTVGPARNGVTPTVRVLNPTRRKQAILPPADATTNPGAATNRTGS